MPLNFFKQLILVYNNLGHHSARYLNALRASNVAFTQVLEKIAINSIELLPYLLI